MFDKYLESYLLKMDSIKIVKETIENNTPKRIDKEINKYQDAILMDYYFNQLLMEKPNKDIESYFT